MECTGIVKEDIKRFKQYHRTNLKENYNALYESIEEWSKLINPQWTLRNYDKIIINFLYNAIIGNVTKILLSVPSRHGKSTLISKNFISYFLTQFPNEKVILSSYSQRLASDFGLDVKNIINNYSQYTKLKPTISTDSKAKNKFNLASPFAGRMLATGSSGSILGFGAGLFVIDDPIKNVAEANSPIIQERLQNWFYGTAKTRLEKRTNGLPPIMIVIAQRLHQRDLHGIIKENEPYIEAQTAIQKLKQGGQIPTDTWVNINFPAICTDPRTDLLGRQEGEVLWQEQRDYQWLMSEKEAMGSYLFNAIYQGEPEAKEGDLFKRSWFYDDYGKSKVIIKLKDVPKDLPLIRCWDFAASGKQGDETAGVLTGYDGNTMYVLDLVNGAFTAAQSDKTYIQTTYTDGKHVQSYIEQEGGSASKMLISRYRRNKKLRGYFIRTKKPRGNKAVRSYSLRSLAEFGRLKIVKAPWNEKMIHQLIEFTGEEGYPDDIVDSLTASCNHWVRAKNKIII